MRTFKLKKLKRVHGIHFTPDGKRMLAVGGEEARMIDSAVWLDLATGENVGRIDQFAECYAVDPTLSRYVLGGATRGRGWGGIAPVQWTALAGPVEWQKVKIPSGEVTGLAFDSSGEHLAASYWRKSRNLQRQLSHNKLAILRMKDASVVAQFATAESGGVIAFNGDSTRVAMTGGIDGGTEAETFAAATGQPVFRFRPPATVTRCVLFLPDNRLVVANGAMCYVLPPDNAKPLFTLAGHPKQVNAVALTPDGRRILTASHDGSIRVWNADTGEAGPQFDWEIGAVTAVAFAPDGLTCAAAGLNGKVALWDVDE